jgi:hypothetical protein
MKPAFFALLVLLLLLSGCSPSLVGRYRYQGWKGPDDYVLCLRRDCTYRAEMTSDVAGVFASEGHWWLAHDTLHLRKGSVAGPNVPPKVRCEVYRQEADSLHVYVFVYRSIGLAFPETVTANDSQVLRPLGYGYFMGPAGPVASLKIGLATGEVLEVKPKAKKTANSYAIEVFMAGAKENSIVMPPYLFRKGRRLLKPGYEGVLYRQGRACDE